MNKGTWSAIALGLIVLALSVFFIMREGGRAPAPVPLPPSVPETVRPPVAVLAEVSGAVDVERDGKRLRGRDRLELFSGDRISVATTGTASVIWPTYGRTLLGAGTTVELARAEMGERRQTMRVWIRLEAGRIWTRIQRLLAAGSSFDVQAGDVVATVRGTSFGVSLVGGKVSVRVVESKVEMRHMKKDGPAEILEMEQEPVVVSAGEAMEIPVDSDVPASAWEEPHVMTQADQLDPMMQEGDAIVSQDLMLFEAAPETPAEPEAINAAPVEDPAPEASLDATVPVVDAPLEVPIADSSEVPLESAAADPLATQP